MLANTLAEGIRIGEAQFMHSGGGVGLSLQHGSIESTRIIWMQRVQSFRKRRIFRAGRPTVNKCCTDVHKLGILHLQLLCQLLELKRRCDV